MKAQTPEPPARWRRLLPLGALAAGAALLGWALLGRTSDEERILAQLTRLERLVEVSETTAQNPAFRAITLKRELPEVFDREVLVSVPELSQARLHRDELAPLAARAQADYESFRVSFRAPAVELLAEQRTARVAVVTHLAATRAGEGALERDERHTRFTFAKDADDRWLIREVQVDTRSVIPD